jgi:hypothetical protein
MHSIPILSHFLDYFPIEFLKLLDHGHRGKTIATNVTYFVLYTTFFVAFAGVTEFCLKPVVPLESLKHLGQSSIRPHQDLCYDRRHIVKPHNSGSATHFFKDTLQSMEKAYGILCRQDPTKLGVAVWE